MTKKPPRKKGEQFTLYREATKRLVKGIDNQTESNEVANIDTYRDTLYIEMQIKGLTMCFKIPERVADYLNEF